VHHAHLWGERERFEKIGQKQELISGKYHWLAENDISTTEWKKADAKSSSYLFIPQDDFLKDEYEQGSKIIDIFGTADPKKDGGKKYGLGICTHNDELHVGWTQAEVFDRVQKLASETISDNTILETLPVKESPYWNTARERSKVRKSQWQEKILTIYYRPFDWRIIYYEPDLMEIGRGGGSRYVMEHAKSCHRNLMLSKGYEVEDFQHVLVSNAVAVHHAATRKEGNYLFPLYLYPDTKQKTLLDTEEPSTAPGGRRPNLSPAFVAALSEKLALGFVPDGRGDLLQTFGPEDVFSYMYAVFHAPTYRARYAEFLKIDFPRLPLTSDVELFRALCGLGQRLVALHLMESFSKTVVPSFPIKGNNVVEKVEYQNPSSSSSSSIVGTGLAPVLPTDAPVLHTNAPIPSTEQTEGRVYINKTQYFGGVPADVWAFHVGGYQVCHKWLKDRKGRVLSYLDVQHYGRVVGALAETIVLMERVDEVIEEHGGWPLG